MLKKKYLIYILAVLVIISALGLFFRDKKPAEKIYINSEDIYLGKDMQKKLSVTLEPADADKLEYMTDDYRVAYIEDGYVKATGEGETYIYIKSSDVLSNKVRVVVSYRFYKDLDNGVVYTTPKGSKYHKRDCSIINPILVEYTEYEALLQGKQPCTKCIK